MNFNHKLWIFIPFNNSTVCDNSFDLKTMVEMNAFWRLCWKALIPKKQITVLISKFNFPWSSFSVFLCPQHLVFLFFIIFEWLPPSRWLLYFFTYQLKDDQITKRIRWLLSRMVKIHNFFKRITTLDPTRFHLWV